MTSPDGPSGKILQVKIADLPQEYPHKDAVPAMTPVDKQNLFASVAAHGVKVPILTYGPRCDILDGHHRIAAAHAAGLTHIPMRFMGDLSAAEAAEWAVRYNVERRQLNDYQTYELLANIAGEEKEKTRRAKIAGTPAGRESERVAARMGMSKDSVKRAKKVKEQGAPELKARVRSGQTSLKAGAREIDEARGQKKKAKKDAQRALPAANDMAGKFGTIYIDLRREEWIVTAGLHEPSEIRDTTLEAYACSPAELLEWYARPTSFVIAARVRPRDLPHAADAIAHAFDDVDLVGAKASTGVAAGMRVIQVSADDGDADDSDYEARHSYLVIAYVHCGIDHKAIEPATSAPLAIRAENVFREITQQHPGPALAVLDRQPDPTDMNRMPADWEFVTDRELRDAATPSRKTSPATAGGAATEPEWRTFDIEDGVAPAAEPLRAGRSRGSGGNKRQAAAEDAAAARKRQAADAAHCAADKARQKKRRAKREGAGAGATTAADVARGRSKQYEGPDPEATAAEISDMVRDTYFAAVAAATKQKEGTTFLWLTAQPDVETKEPDLATAMTKLTASVRKPAGRRACLLLAMPHAKYPAAMAKQLRRDDVDVERDDGIDFLIRTMPTRQGERIMGDLAGIESSLTEAMADPTAWK